jgi:diguanylate cyclase (GGDEF)-like protein/PAS domain S-box-containing protein
VIAVPGEMLISSGSSGGRLEDAFVGGTIRVEGQAAGRVLPGSDAGVREVGQQSLRAVIESNFDGMVVIDRDGAVLFVNPAAERLLGRVSAEVVGAQFGFPQTPGGAVEIEVVAGGALRVAEMRVVQVVWEGAPAFLASLRDVSERKRVECELHRLAEAAQHGTDAVVSIGLEGQICHWNPGAELLYGWSAGEAVGRQLDELLTVASGEPGDEIARMLAGEPAYQFETQRRRKDGTIVDVRLTVSAWTVDGNVVGVTSVTIDVSGRRARERESERLAAAADYGTDAVMSIDLDGLVRHWNRGAERLYGFTSEEAIGRPVFELTRIVDGPQRGKARAQDAIARILGGEAVHQVASQSRRKGGGIVDVLTTVAAWHRDGRVVGVTAVATDVSERKGVERAREQTLAELELHTQLLDLAHDAVIVREPVESRVTFWNPQAQAMYGYSGDQALGRVTHDLFVTAFPESREVVDDALARDGHWEGDLRHTLQDGTQIVVASRQALQRDRDGRATAIIELNSDVTGLREAEVALRDAEEHFRGAFDEAPIGMALMSADGRLEQANPALGVICGRTRDELVQMRLRELLHPADADRASEALGALGAGAIEQLAIELRIIPAVGSPLDISVNATRLNSGPEQATHVLCQFQDVTDRKRYEEQLQFMSDHDPLTGLDNRRKFEAELDRHVEHVNRYGPEGALLMLDIDHFKTINDTLGHSAGDQLLVSISSVLRGRLRTSDPLARLGGDEFAVLLPKADEATAAQVAQELASAVRSSTALLGDERRKVTTSIGIAMFDTNADQLAGETIVIEADLAMYDAKEAGGDGHAFYATSEHHVSRTKARVTWIGRIEQALEDDRFALLAQPILDLHTGDVRQHELLLRMLDDHDDLIPPAAFLNIAERFGLIAKLDQWVATRAIELIEQRPELQLQVNISGRSLGDRKLLQTIDNRLRTSSIDPSRLIFEVTETAAVANITHAQAFAQQLRDRGCRFALDDFGAGFGSFYYLKHLPFDYVKIDGEFVQHATSGHIDQLVIEAVVRIAQGLGKETIAEFVTDEKTQRMVTRLGVDYAQGHHIGKPVPIAKLTDTSSTHLGLPPTANRPGRSRRLNISSGKPHARAGAAERSGGTSEPDLFHSTRS